jgi:hypothetical protein
MNRKEIKETKAIEVVGKALCFVGYLIFGVVVFVRLFVRSTLTLRPGWSPASGGNRCDDSLSTVSGRIFPVDAVFQPLSPLT